MYLEYDLHLDGESVEHVIYTDEETVVDQDIIFDADSETPDIETAVKVLSEKSHAEVLKIVDDFRKNQPVIDPNSALSINLSKEFEEILSTGCSGLVN